MVYQYTYCRVDMDPITLLSQRGPLVSIYAACRLTREESMEVYDHALAIFRRTRAGLLEGMLADVRTRCQRILNEAGNFQRRDEWLMRAIYKLARGADRHCPEDDKCNHTWREFDSHYCGCEEHESCFNCGKWLALAVFGDLRRTVVVRLLIQPAPRFGSLESVLTKFGKDVANQTMGQIQDGTELVEILYTASTYPAGD